VHAPSEPGVEELGRVDEPEPTQATMATFRALAALFRPYRRSTILIGLCLLVEAAFNAFLPLSFSFLIDKALIPKDKEALVVILVALAVAVVVGGAVGLGRDKLYANLTARVVADLRLRLFEHLQGLSIGFFQRTQLGDVLSRFSGDLIAVENAFASALAWAVAPGLDVCVYTVILFVLDWRLALVSMLVWPIALLGPRHFAPQAVGASVEKKQLEAATLSVVQENVSGQPVVKAFSLERPWLESFEERSEKLRRRSAHVSFVSMLVERSSLVGILILDVAVIGIGSWLAFDGSLSIGKLVAFQGLFLALGYSLSYVTQYFPSLVHALGGYDHIATLLDEQPQVRDADDAGELPRLAGEIAFDGVTFGYTPAQVNLKDFSAQIRRGESVAFVGSSGSGKSTVLSLLMRLYDPAAGTVTVDGHDLRGVTQASLRSQLGVVFQESFLFNATVRENIRMAKPTATDADVVEAARAAEIHDFVAALPLGYDTVVGERGGLLSGGQRQRIAIARAVLRDPAVLILDEATSALDPGTEEAINATLERLGQARTTVAVTHRLAAAKNADRIFVFDKGALVESGSHDELLRTDGLYAQLWNRQSGFTLLDDGERAEVDAARLAEVPLLADVDLDLLADVAKLFTSERVPAGRVVVQEGDEGDHFFLVVRGRVSVTREDESGTPIRVNTHEDGDHFGEVALLRAGPRIATVTAEIPTLLLSLAREHFLRLLETAPDVRATLERRIDEYLAQWSARDA
jgi:ATP-binding cassette, subfamily B, bacterial